MKLGADQLITEAEIEDLRAMYSQWVDFVHAAENQSFHEHGTLRNSVSETITKLDKAAGPVVLMEDDILTPV